MGIRHPNGVFISWDAFVFVLFFVRLVSFSYLLCSTAFAAGGIFSLKWVWRGYWFLLRFAHSPSVLIGYLLGTPWAETPGKPRRYRQMPGVSGRSPGGAGAGRRDCLGEEEFWNTWFLMAWRGWK